MMPEPAFADSRTLEDLEPGTRVVAFVLVDHHQSQLREGTALEPKGNMVRVEFDDRLPHVNRSMATDKDGTNPKIRRFLLKDIRLMRRTDYNLLRRDGNQVREWVNRGDAISQTQRDEIARKLRGPGIEKVKAPSYIHEPVVERKTFTRRSTGG